MNIYKSPAKKSVYWLELNNEQVRIPFTGFEIGCDGRNVTLYNKDSISASLWNGGAEAFLLLAKKQGLKAVKVS